VIPTISRQQESFSRNQGKRSRPRAQRQGIGIFTEARESAAKQGANFPDPVFPDLQGKARAQRSLPAVLNFGPFVSRQNCGAIIHTTKKQTTRE